MAEAAHAPPSLSARLANLLPKGTPLPESDWSRRHLVILGLLWVHVPILFAFGILNGAGPLHSLWEASIVATAGVLASLPRLWPTRYARLERWHRSARATVAGFGLVSSSAILVHLSGGYIELHFHFFVMVAVMAFYQDWPPFLMAIGFVAGHHGIVGALDPHSVYNHPAALAHPWRWAGLHAFFILCASAAAITAWRFSEEARRKTEQANVQLRGAVSLVGATLESTADGLLVVDRQGRITSHNQKFADMWRIRPDVLASGDDARALNSVLAQLKEPQAFLAKVEELYAQPEAESFDVIEFRDGRTFERVSKPQRVDGKPVGRVWSFRDVTERRRAEQDRLVAGQRLMEIERLQEVNQFKTHLLNTASHELNTPLTPLRLQLNVLKAQGPGELSERQRKSVQILDRNLERLATLVQNVLDVSRLQSHRMRLNLSHVDVAGLAAEAAEAFEPDARQKGIQFGVEADPGSFVTADSHRVTQVVFNLVANALKFTPAGGRVTLRVHARPEGVRVSVEDTGRGLAPAEKGQLFQPFTQVGDQSSLNGTGLGLYICRGIVEAHGGGIGCESQGAGKGSTFWFDLPHAPPPGVLQPGPSAPEAAAAS